MKLQSEHHASGAFFVDLSLTLYRPTIGLFYTSGILLPMELTSDRIETSVRLLQNGRYVWTVTTNTKLDDPMLVERLKQMDGKLRDAFPNHVKENSTRFSELE